VEKVAWVAGEVLVDLIPASDGDESIGGQRYRAVIGGGPANTAKALARLGKRCEFIGGLSSDRFGHMAWMELEHAGVGLDLVDESDRPTAKAIVEVDSNGSARYSFEVEESATFSFDESWLPQGDPDVLHIGTLASVITPGSEKLMKWTAAIKESGATIVFDPNVRSAFLGDRSRYREIVEGWVALADIVKASEEEIEWLYPDSDREAVAMKWMDAGVQLVVMTRGARGMVALRQGESVGVAGVEVDVIDTVGAGDTVGALLVEAVLELGLEHLRGEELTKVLRRAAHAAAITCSREGANPPTLNELNESLSRINP
jgi:fructokinase